MRLLAVIWDFNPVFFSLGPVEIRWYGIMWMLGFAVSLWLFVNFTKREGYPPRVLDSFFWFAFLSTIIGSRLGHLLFYDAKEFFADPVEFFRFWNGGLASHGAAFGLLIGLWLFSRHNKMPYIWSLDRIMVAVAIAGALVRIGNLFNSEIYGGVTTLPWGFEFVADKEGWPKNSPEGLPVHPTQIYEALCYLAGFAVLAWLYYKKDMARRRPGLMFGVGLIFIFATRFVIEFIKNPQEDFEIGMMLNMGQWLSAPFIVMGVWLIVRASMRPAITPPPLKPWAEPAMRKQPKRR